MAGSNSDIVVEGEPEETFEVENIVGKSVINGEVRYKIRWKGYGPEDDTWEPLQNMQSCMDLLHMYEKRRQQKEDENRKAQMKCSSKTQKDTFWKDLESGHISDIATDIYSRVKTKKRLEHMPVSPAKTSDQVGSANEESLGDKKRKVKTQSFSREDEKGKRIKSSSRRKEDSEMDHSQVSVDRVEVQDKSDSPEVMSTLPHVCNSSDCWNYTTSSEVVMAGNQESDIVSKECHGSTGNADSSNLDNEKDNSSSKCKIEKVNMKNKDESTVKNSTMKSGSRKKRKSSASCKLSHNQMTSEVPVSNSIQKKQMPTTGVTIGNTSPLEVINKTRVNASSDDQETSAIQLPEKSPYTEPTEESNLGIHKTDPVSNHARPIKRRVSSLPSLADLLRRNDDSEVVYISSTDSDESSTCKVDTDESLAFSVSRPSSINGEHCESLTKLNTECKSFDIQKDGDLKDLIGLGKSVSSKRKTGLDKSVSSKRKTGLDKLVSSKKKISFVAAYDSEKKKTGSVDIVKIKDEPTVQVSKTLSNVVEKFDDTKTGFSPCNNVMKNDSVPMKTTPYPSASLIMSCKIRGTVRENDNQGHDGCNRTCDSELKEMTIPCSFKTEEHKAPTGPVKQASAAALTGLSKAGIFRVPEAEWIASESNKEADEGFDIELDDLDWAQLEEELRLKALSDEDFQRAVWNGNFHLVQQALSCNEIYDLECRDLSGKTLLMTAADKGFECLAVCLLENGAIVDAQMKDGTTALMLAAQKGFSSIVDVLVKLGAKVNRQTGDGDTALMMATRQGHVELVKQLLLYGANFSAENKDGATALIYSQMSKISETENAIVRHISRITTEYEKHLSITLNNTAKIVSTVFPLQCFNLCEGTEFIVKFSHVSEALKPGVGFLLFIAHAMFLTNEVHCRFYGPCAVISVYLNEVKQISMTQEGNFVFSFNPVVGGNNQLVIKTMKASQSKLSLNKFASQIFSASIRDTGTGKANTALGDLCKYAVGDCLAVWLRG